MKSRLTTVPDLDQAIRVLGVKAGRLQMQTQCKPSMPVFVPKRKKSPEQVIAEKLERYTQEYVGKTFGTLLVIGPVVRAETRAWRVLCRCMECGTETMWPITSLSKRDRCTCSNLLHTREKRDKKFLTNRRHPMEAIIHQWVRGKAA